MPVTYCPDVAPLESRSKLENVILSTGKGVVVPCNTTVILKSIYAKLSPASVSLMRVYKIPLATLIHGPFD